MSGVGHGLIKCAKNAEKEKHWGRNMAIGAALAGAGGYARVYPVAGRTYDEIAREFPRLVDGIKRSTYARRAGINRAMIMAPIGLGLGALGTVMYDNW